MFIIAQGLENGNPFAYLLCLLLILPPAVFIIMVIIENIIDKIKKK